MNKTLKTLDSLARGQRVFTASEFRERYGGSAQSAANALSRAIRDGIVERIARGRYIMREFGRLGTHASTEDVLLALSPIVVDREHRVAYLTALEYHSLLLYPQTEIQIALASPTRLRTASGRRLRPVVELPKYLAVGAIDAEYGCRVSDLNRSLLDAARRMDLIGGVDIVADALRLGRQINVEAVVEYADRLDAHGAVRRLGSIAGVIGRDELASALSLQAEIPVNPVPVDPSSSGEVTWVDPHWKVAWDSTSADLVALSVGA